MIPDEVATLLECGVSILIGSRDGQLVPESMRAMGVRVEPGRESITVYLPEATASSTLRNLHDNQRIAVCFSRAIDHRSIQVKGEVESIRPADRGDRDAIEHYRQMLVEQWTLVGVPPRITLRLAHWPSHAVRLRVESVFVQTPGPGAGDALASPRGRDR